MAGFGLAPYGGRKEQVERCLTISADLLQREKKIRSKAKGSGYLSWSYSSTGDSAGSALYEVSTLEQDGYEYGTLVLRYSTDGEPVVCRVHLKASPLPWGGIRWGFVCPVCGSARRKLHLPPGGRFFACRLCYDLTYRSCQESHKFDAMFRRLGVSEKRMKEILGTD